MVSQIETEPTFNAQTPEPLFSLRAYPLNGGRQYDVAPSGDRFIFRRRAVRAQTNDDDSFNGLARLLVGSGRHGGFGGRRRWRDYWKRNIANMNPEELEKWKAEVSRCCRGGSSDVDTRQADRRDSLNQRSGSGEKMVLMPSLIDDSLLAVRS